MLTEKDILLAQELDFPVTLFEDFRQLSPSNGEFERLTTLDYDVDPDSEEINEFQVPQPGFLFTCTADTADDLLENLHDKWREQGFYVFIAEMNYEQDLDKVGVLKTEDMFDVVRVRQTEAGEESDLTNEDIIAKLQEWDSRHPLIITGADFDWVEAVFIEPPTDFLAFAKEVQAICPDVVEQGTGSLAELAKEMQETNTIFLWWE